MALPDWVPIAGLAAGFLTMAVSALKVKPEARKMRQDGTAALMTSTGALLAGVQNEMHELRTEVRSLKEAGRVHSRWDNQVVRQLSAAGIEVPDPPPLWDVASER